MRLTSLGCAISLPKKNRYESFKADKQDKRYY